MSRPRSQQTRRCDLCGANFIPVANESICGMCSEETDWIEQEKQKALYGEADDWSPRELLTP